MFCDRPGLRTVAVDANGIVYALGFSDGLIVIRFLPCSAEFSPAFRERDAPHFAVPDARLDGHRGEVIALAFGVRDDIAYLASTADDRQVILWRNRAGEWRNSWSVTDVDATSVALSDSGNFFAFALTDGSVRVYKDFGEDKFAIFAAGAPGRCAVTFSRDNLVTVDGRGALKIWDAAKPIAELQLSNSAVRCLSACGDSIGAIVRAPTTDLSLVQTVRRSDCPTVVLRPGIGVPMRFSGQCGRISDLARPTVHGELWPPCEPDIGFYWTAGGHGMVLIAYASHSQRPERHSIWQTNVVEHMDGEWVMGDVTPPAGNG
jgi:hypothetical protein